MDPDRVRAYLQVACAGLGFDIGEIWWSSNAEGGTSTALASFGEFLRGMSFRCRINIVVYHHELMIGGSTSMARLCEDASRFDLLMSPSLFTLYLRRKAR